MSKPQRFCSNIGCRYTAKCNKTFTLHGAQGLLPPQKFRELSLSNTAWAAQKFKSHLRWVGFVSITWAVTLQPNLVASRASRLLWLCQLSQPGPWSCVPTVLFPGAWAHSHGTELLLGSVPAAHPIHTAAAPSCATKTTKGTSDSLPAAAAAATAGAAKVQQKTAELWNNYSESLFLLSNKGKVSVSHGKTQLDRDKKKKAQLLFGKQVLHQPS